MAVFKFEALDAAGKVSKGTVEADSAKLARNRLRDMQLSPLKVEALESEAEFSSGFLGRQRLTASELCLVTRQTSTLLTAGLTVDQALAAVIEQAEGSDTRVILQGVRAQIVAGDTFSKAMAKYPSTFPEIYRAIVFAGEESGELANVMARLADYTERRNFLKQKVIVAFIYPALVTVVALLVISGLLIYVVPQVVASFEQSSQTLPLLTRALILLSRWFGVLWPYLLGMLLLVWFIARYALKDPKIRMTWHSWLLQTPLIGNMIRGLNTARLASTLSILVGSGVPILKALHAATQIVTPLPMRAAMEEASAQVRDGKPLSMALKARGLFPPILIHLVSNAEATGRLDEMLQSAAEQQSREMETRIGVITALLEPVLILVMGLLVLLIVLAILLPIIEMNQLIR